MRSFLTPFLAVTLLVVPVAKGQSVFTVSPATACTALYAQLDSLLASSGPYSVRLDSRRDDYVRIETSLAGLQEQSVPHINVDFTPLPRVEATGLQPTTRSVRRTESDPRVAEGLASLGLGGLLLYSAFASDDSDTATYGALLGLLFVSGGVSFLTNTRTVIDEVPDNDAIQANSAIRSRVAEENRRIDAINADRQRMRIEHDRAVAANEGVAAARARLTEEIGSYEEESSATYVALVNSLTEEGSRRCIDNLIVRGVALRLSGLRGDVYIVMQPVNRSGQLITDRSTLETLRVNVTKAVIREPLIELARLPAPVEVPLQELGSELSRLWAGDGYVAAVALELEYEPVEANRISAEVVVQIAQDDRAFAASWTDSVRLLR